MTRIFVSFSHADALIAESLVNWLSSLEDVEPFYSPHHALGISAGKPWFERIVEELRNSEGLIFLATPSSVAEPWPLFEVGAVFGRRFPTVSILVGMPPKDLPGPMAPIQAVSATESTDIFQKRVLAAFALDSKCAQSPETTNRLGEFHRRAAAYRAPQKTSALEVTIDVMHSIPEHGPRPATSEKIVLVKVINRNSHAVRIASVCLEQPSAPGETNRTFITSSRIRLPQIVAAHDAATFVFPALQQLVGVPLTALASLTTGEELKSAATATITQQMLDENPYVRK